MSKNEDKKKVMDGCDSIETACLKKFAESKEKPFNSQCQKSWTNSSYIGIIVRVQKYKKKLYEHFQKERRACNQPLMDLTVVQRLNPVIIITTYGQNDTHSTLVNAAPGTSTSDSDS